MIERGRWRTRWEIHKFRDPTGDLTKRVKAGESLEAIRRDHSDKLICIEIIEGNCLLNEGIDYLWDIVCGIVGSPTLWSSANARVGVGNSTTGAAPAQTDLLAETVEFRGSFADGQAEFAWEEYVVDNGAVSGKTLNRKVSSKGTKGSGELWTLRLLITIT